MNGGGFELSSVFGVVDPLSVGVDSFARNHAWHVAGDGDDFASFVGLNLENGVAVDVVMMGDTLHHAAETCGGGRFGALVHCCNKRVLGAGDKLGVKLGGEPAVAKKFRVAWSGMCRNVVEPPCSKIPLQY